MTTTFEEVTLTTTIRRKAERILSSYRNLDALISTLEMDKPMMRNTPVYELIEGKGSLDIQSKVEQVVLKRLDIEERLEEKKHLKQKLDTIYSSLTDRQKNIWTERYIHGRFDETVYNELNISQRQYYREKNALLNLVAEAFYLI